MAARALAPAVATLVLAAGVALVLLTRSEQAVPKPRSPAAAPTGLSPEQVSRAPTSRAGGAARGPLGAQLVRPVLLRDRPGGRILRSIGKRTEFGSPRVMAVVEQRPGWLGVLSEHVANSRAAWIPDTGAQLLLEPYTLQADLSARTLVVRRRGRVARRITVAIGRPGTTTPTGLFAVTDALVDGRPGSPYGCCVLALTGRQPNVPQGWTGGDRLAVHGTTNERTLGTPASSGCLRAAEKDMRWLIANVPLGAPVRIRA